MAFKLKKKIKLVLTSCLRMLNVVSNLFGLSVVRSRDLISYHLHEYNAYEEYAKIQVSENVRKIDNVWADETTLQFISEEIKKYRPQDKEIMGLCHGTRNGFEQKYFNDTNSTFSCIGTDISETARNYPNSVVHDFHEVKNEWSNKFSFVYSNSLDHAYDPRKALTAWLDQLCSEGGLIIEHSQMHSPLASSKLDPFGVKADTLTHLLVNWFGHSVSIKHEDHQRQDGSISTIFFIKKIMTTTHKDQKNLKQKKVENDV